MEPYDFSELSRTFYVGSLADCPLTVNLLQSVNDEVLDEIIDAYLNLLVQQPQQPGEKVYHVPTATIYSIFMEGKPLLNKVNLEEYTKLIGILHEQRDESDHWTTLLCNMTTKELIYLDSSGQAIRNSKGKINRWRSYLKTRGIESKGWVIRTPPHSVQRDEISCGIFALAFAEELLKQEPLLDDIDVNRQRRKIVDNLVTAAVPDKRRCHSCRKNCKKNISYCHTCARPFHGRCLSGGTCALCKCMDRHTSEEGKSRKGQKTKKSSPAKEGEKTEKSPSMEEQLPQESKSRKGRKTKASSSAKKGQKAKKRPGMEEELPQESPEKRPRREEPLPPGHFRVTSRLRLSNNKKKNYIVTNDELLRRRAMENFSATSLVQYLRHRKGTEGLMEQLEEAMGPFPTNSKTKYSAISGLLEGEVTDIMTDLKNELEASNMSDVLMSGVQPSDNLGAALTKIVDNLKGEMEEHLHTNQFNLATYGMGLSMLNIVLDWCRRIC